MNEELLIFYRDFFAWCTVLNIIFLLCATVALTLMKNTVQVWHSRLLGIEQAALPKLYFQYLAGYKLLVIVFNLVPYLVLRAMIAG